jgi:hypothetical protein
MKRIPYVTSTNAEGLALSGAAVTFSVLALVLSPWLSTLGFIPRLFAALIAGLSLAVLVVTFRRMCHRSWAEPLLGQWLYMTIPHDPGKRTEQGFGVANISVSSGGGLGYRVDLYRNGEAAVRAARGEAVGAGLTSHGTAHGVATRYEDDNETLWILYRVEYFSDQEPDREGHLMVRTSGPAGRRELSGIWASDLNGRELSAGTMVLMRPGDFPAFLASLP